MAKCYLYLDQRDLINLSKGGENCVKARLHQEISSGSIQVVLSLMHVIETWKYAYKKEKQHLAAYADSLSPIWLLFRSVLFCEEIMRAFSLFQGEKIVTVLDIGHPQFNHCYPCSVGKNKIFSPFRRSVIETLSSTSIVSDPDDYARSFSQMLNLFEEDPRIAKTVVEVHKCYPEWSRDIKTRVPGELPGKIKWIFETTRLATRSLNISDVMLENFVYNLDIRACPSIYIYMKIKDAINKDKTPTPHPSEMVDIVHVSALPYCDAFSTDKRIWDYIRRCKIKIGLFPDGYARLANTFKSLANALNFFE